MARRRRTDRYGLKQKRRELLSLQMDAKIKALKKELSDTPPKAASRGERVLLEELAAQRREAYFTARELELVNYQRDMVGLPPLNGFEPDVFKPPPDLGLYD